MTFSGEIFFVRALLPLVLGIISVYPIKHQIDTGIVQCLAWSIFFMLAFANGFYKKYALYQSKGFIGLLAYLFWFTFGALLCSKNHETIDEAQIQRTPNPIFKVWIINEPQLKNGILRIEVKLTSKIENTVTMNMQGKLLVIIKTAPQHHLRLNYGDECMITGSLSPIKPPQNPGEFDFKSWMATKNITHQLFIHPKQLVKLPTHKGNPFLRYAFAIRKRQVETFRQLIKNDQAFAVASTLLLGYRTDLNQETISAYSKTGTIHALSVSGAHVGIIYLLLNGLLFFLNRFKIIKLVAICITIWYYSLLTGFSPSVLRSAMMLTVYLTAKAYNKNNNNYNTLAFTAFCLLIYDPFLIWDVGFQLSFSAVFGLIYLQPKCYQILFLNQKWLDHLWSSISLSLAAQIATLPLSIYYFHQFPVYFLISNLFILFPLSAMMYLGILTLLLPIPFIASLFEWIILFTNKGLNCIAELPLSGINDIWITKWQVLILIVALMSLTLALVHYHKQMLMLSISAFIVFQFFGAYQQLQYAHQRQVLFFSLRNHYAAAFISGEKAVVVSSLREGDPDFIFSILPALAQQRVKIRSLISWETDTVIGNFVKKNHQISYLQTKILLVDYFFNNKKILGTPRFDVVWLHQNPKKKLNELQEEISFSNIIMDASNHDFTLKSYEKQAHKIGKAYHVLKKNTSYLIDLNEINHE